MNFCEAGLSFFFVFVSLESQSSYLITFLVAGFKFASVFCSFPLTSFTEYGHLDY